MSLLTDIRFFLKKFIKNPIIMGAIAYTFYMIITKHAKKEAFAESIKVIKKGSKGRAVIYDDKVGKYILVDHDKGIFSDSKPDKLLKMLED